MQLGNVFKQDLQDSCKLGFDRGQILENRTLEEVTN